MQIVCLKLAGLRLVDELISVVVSSHGYPMVVNGQFMDDER